MPDKDIDRSIRKWEEEQEKAEMEHDKFSKYIADKMAWPLTESELQEILSDISFDSDFLTEFCRCYNLANDNWPSMFSTLGAIIDSKIWDEREKRYNKQYHEV